MKRFVEGEDRRQATLLPECLDDYVAPDNPVRIIEAFVDELDLAALGFAGERAAHCLLHGQPRKGERSSVAGPTRRISSHPSLPIPRAAGATLW